MAEVSSNWLHGWVNNKSKICFFFSDLNQIKFLKKFFKKRLEITGLKENSSLLA